MKTSRAEQQGTVSDAESSSRSRGFGGCTTGRISLCLMTLFFVLAASAQLNDPDPLLWMCIYSLPALLTFASFINVRVMDKTWWWVCVSADLAAHIAFSIIFISAAATKGRISWNILYFEESRESCGLIIVGIWLLILLSVSSRRINSNIWLMAGALVYSILILVSWVGYHWYWQVFCELPNHCSGIV